MFEETEITGKPSEQPASDGGLHFIARRKYECKGYLAVRPSLGNYFLQNGQAMGLAADNKRGLSILLIMRRSFLNVPIHDPSGGLS